MPRTLTIIGGGLAGLTLGIELRERGIPVKVVEAGHYPRHRVCGEFISGRGQAILARLGLESRMAEAGMIPARSTQFFAGQRRSRLLRLPQTAWSISRAVLDALLARAFQERDGLLQTGTRWTEPWTSEGIIRAAGRRLTPSGAQSLWMGLKSHAKNVDLSVDLELHLNVTGYVGLSRLADGCVNVCGLFRLRSERPRDVFDLLRGMERSALRDRLHSAVWVEGSRCSVAGLNFGKLQFNPAECVIGDALAMIPPFTGNGMSMAIESAHLAAPELHDYYLGRLSWAESCQNIRQRCRETFLRRLRWGGWIQKALVQPLVAPYLVRALDRFGWFWKLPFDRTR